MAGQAFTFLSTEPSPQMSSYSFIACGRTWPAVSGTAANNSGR